MALFSFSRKKIILLNKYLWLKDYLQSPEYHSSEPATYYVNFLTKELVRVERGSLLNPEYNKFWVEQWSTIFYKA